MNKSNSDQRLQSWRAVLIQYCWVIAFALLVIGASTRLLPHVPNLTATGAVIIFGAMYLPKRVALLVPLALLLLTDLWLGTYTWQIMVSVYVGFIGYAFLGFWARRDQSFVRSMLAAIGGGIGFYLLTNAAVWMFSGMYPVTFVGLLQSYTMGLPFLRMTLIGDLIYTATLVGSFQWLVVGQVSLPQTLKSHAVVS